MNRRTLIQSLINSKGYERYLEIGTGVGWVINNVECKHKDGVDPGVDGPYTSEDEVKKGQSWDHVNYPMTSNEFFEGPAKSLEGYDLIFIDGLHEAWQVDKDIENSLKMLKPGGTIILHDCNPINEERQIVPRINAGPWNGDVWKSIVRYRASNPELNCLTINTDEGLGVISNEIMQGPNFEMPEELTYDWLNKNREAALYLVEPDVASYLLNL